MNFCHMDQTEVNFCQKFISCKCLIDWLISIDGALKIFNGYKVPLTNRRKEVGLLESVYVKNEDMWKINRYSYEFFRFSWIAPPKTGLN